MLLENMKMAFAALKANKMRSFLTMLGIIIGIGSVIAIVSIGDTMRRMFTDLYKDVGITQAFIQPGYWLEDLRQSDYFTVDDIEKLKEIFGDDIAYIDSSASVSGEITVGRRKKNFNLTGIDYNYQDVQPVDIVYGRYLNEGDIKGRKQNAVMEAEAAKEMFGSENAVGKTFRMTVYGSVLEFNIVGVYKKEMSPFQKLMMGTGNGTGEAFIPWTLLTWPNDFFYSLRYFADTKLDEEQLSALNSDIVSYIARSKGRNAEDFYFTTAANEMGAVDSVLGGVSAAVGGIAAISLLVGGIGIMNIMLVSVTERTREIGTRKALGATTTDIMIQFLTESAVLSAVGGLIGVMLAAGLVSLGGLIFSLPVVIKPGVVIMAVGFSALVGIFFGIYPAKKAAANDPIIALRYE